ncbi:MAG TPA: DUF4382 domain-containing protein [Terriglobales bacterium]|nr:DUF4382 domain-containing protein [Terriglobales bacterium]
MKRSVLLFAVSLLLAVWTGCGGGSTAPSGGASPHSAVFTTGEDAPVSSVVAFNITINNITLNNNSSSVSVLSAPTAVDFGRLIGLRSLLGFNTVPPGTYTSATFTFEPSNPAPSVNYIDLTTTPPSLGTATGVLSATKVTVSFPNGKPLVVSSNGLAGLHMDFDLRDSLATDGSGNLIITNNQTLITPVLDVMAVSASDELGEITECTGNVVSVNVSGNSFVMQGPYGFQRTIDVNANTLYNGSNSLNTLTGNAVVSVEGAVQADGSILASSVEVITTDQAFISGRILAVSPGPVVTMFVGEELGTSATIPANSIYTVNLSLVSQYDVCFLDNWFTNQVFGASSLVVGQRIFVGGTYQNNTFTPDIVSLRRQGVFGTLMPGTVSITSGNQGSFQMQNDALMSYAAGGPFTVFTGNKTIFVNINGLSGLQSAGSAKLVARGLVFYDPATQKPVVWAHRVRVLP